MGYRKKLRHFLCLFLALVLGLQNVAWAGIFDPCCPCTHCPPPLHHCMEGKPKIKFKKGCRRPVCNPCHNPNWGYFQPCWVPWPWPPDWSHCPVPPPASTVFPMPGPNFTTTAEPGTAVPMPISPPNAIRPGF